MPGFDPSSVQAWSANGDYTGAQTNTSLKAAQGVGVTIVVTDIVISNDNTAAITWKLLNGSGGTNLTGTHRLAASTTISISLKHGIELTDNTALCLTTTTTSNFSVFVAGHLAAG